MRLISLIFLLFLLAQSMPAAVMPSVSWGATIRDVFRKHPKLVRLNCCYFDGINVFGSDSLQMFAEYFKSGALERRIFSFQHGRLVSVEMIWRIEKVDTAKFRKAVLDPMSARFKRGVARSLSWHDKTKSEKGRLWFDDKEAAIVCHGRFTTLKEVNLDWMRIRLFKRSFFDFRNQRRYCGRWKGDEKLLHR